MIRMNTADHNASNVNFALHLCSLLFLLYCLCLFFIYFLYRKTFLSKETYDIMVGVFNCL